MRKHHFVTDDDLAQAKDASQECYDTFHAMLTNPSDVVCINDTIRRRHMAHYNELGRWLAFIRDMERAKQKHGKCAASIRFGLLQPRCTGAISGRYAIHATGQCCPMHGTAEDGQRIRASIKTADMEKVEQAISNHSKLKELASELYKLELDINRLRNQLELGTFPPEWATLPKDIR
jgi:hypothetical protein